LVSDGRKRGYIKNEREFCHVIDTANEFYGIKIGRRGSHEDLDVEQWISAASLMGSFTISSEVIQSPESEIDA
jgi:hypothetical protein